MARLSVNEIQSRIAAVIDQDEDTSAIATDDYSLRLKYLNMAQSEWAETYDWDVLYTEFNSLVSTSAGNASIALPINFRKLASFPEIVYDGTNTAKFPAVDPLDDTQYGSTDKRVWILGNPQDSYTLRVFGTTLASGASVRVPYFRSVGSLASPVDIASVPNPDFLVKWTVAKVWESREDPRFPQAKAEAEQLLSNMIEFENVKNPVYNDRVKTQDETRYGFRWGE